jgi:hypothetical protein
MEQVERGWEVELTKRQQKTWYFLLDCSKPIFRKEASDKVTVLLRPEEM